MTATKTQLILLIVAAAWTAAVEGAVAPRLINGVPVDTLRRFPHHVTIEPINHFYGRYKLCGGSILNEQWILTSALCVDGSDRLMLHFEKLYYLSNDGSYTAVVNSDAIHIYPTYYDDIALVKIPFRLIFSDTIRPVNISTSNINLDGRLAVLPGFDAQEQVETTTMDYYTTGMPPARSDSNSRSQQLTYGMFNILPNAKCKSINNEFDEFLQLCTESWSNNWSTPCSSDYGGGLIVGWPANNLLVGIYSVSWTPCNNTSPAIYTNVAKYAPWILNIIQG